MEITKDSIVKSVIEEHPETLAVFKQYGFHALGFKPLILSTALQTLSLFLFISNITLSLFGRGKKMAEKCQPTLAVELAKLRRSY